MSGGGTASAGGAAGAGAGAAMKGKATSTSISQPATYDIVLPLPGISSVFPTNETGGDYAAALKADEISCAAFRIKPISVIAQGAYRPVYAHAHDLAYQWLEQSEAERVAGTHPLQLTFWLDPACYATMLLRELQGVGFPML